VSVVSSADSRTSSSTPAPAGDQPAPDGRALRGEATRRRIVEAAREVLLARGYGGTSTRAVADEAGVRLSLVHYHFGSKQRLLLDVLEHENTGLLERQRELYAAPGPLAEKWRTACDFLDEDVRSGYVRVLWELWAAGLADESLAAGWRSAMGGWRSLLESVFAEWADERGIDLPLRPRALATLVANVFQGIEIELLAGVPPEQAPHREVLDALGALIARAEAPG
jgi:AcrR family transcriptional regulator